MKTIILCGGRGWRMQEETEYKPKPLVTIGELPVLVHIMKRYAMYDYKQFVLALGYKGDMIRDYFLNLNSVANDIELDLATQQVTTLKQNLKLDYKISFIDTGLAADTAERVLKAAKHIDGDQFMVTYGDDVSNVEVDKLVRFHQRHTKAHKTHATITAAHPSSHFGQVWADARDVISRFAEKPMKQDYVNCGYMIFHRKALDHLRKGETLEQGLERMAQKKKLSLYRHEGFWHPMNTAKDVQYLNKLWKKGRPWTK